jgi:hypothetical protein
MLGLARLSTVDNFVKVVRKTGRKYLEHHYNGNEDSSDYESEGRAFESLRVRHIFCGFAEVHNQPFVPLITSRTTSSPSEGS